MEYPPRWHPCYMIESALTELGAQAEVIRNEETLGCWGLRVNGKLMVWLVDNRHIHERITEDPAAARLLDRGVLVCHAQKPDYERVGGHWLPLAASPGYSPANMPKTHEVAFVGVIRDPQRATLLTDVAAYADLRVGEGVFGEEAVNLYRQARIGINIPTGYGSPTCWDANMRVFEIAATGTPVLTNYLPALHELGFENGVNCYTYSSGDEIVPLLTRILDDSAHAERVGQRGAALVKDLHLYNHRARQVLEWLE